MNDCPLLALINIGSNSSVDAIFPKDYFPEIDHGPDSHAFIFTLSIRCKYYEANICVKEIKDEKDLEAAEAVLIHSDCTKSSDWDSIVDWMNLADVSDVQLRLLLCPNLSSLHSMQRNSDSTNIQHLIIKHQFELIELDPVDGTVEDGDEYGIARLKTALEAHVWPNMKTVKPNESAPLTPQAAPTSSPNEPNPELESTDSDPLHLDETMESFERVMKTILDAKEKLSCMDCGERHRLAEKVTMQFWRAFGDSDDEISDQVEQG